MSISVKELAVEAGTDPRTMRKFLRSEASGIEPVGKGSRYSFEKRQIAGLKKKFSKWDEDRKPAEEAETPDEG